MKILVKLIHLKTVLNSMNMNKNLDSEIDTAGAESRFCFHTGLDHLHPALTPTNRKQVTFNQKYNFLA